MKSTEELVPEVESAFARLHLQLRKSERTLRCECLNWKRPSAISPSSKENY